jgi:hypothetical protein
MSVASIAAERPPGIPRGVECRVYERHACGLETTLQPIAARSDKDIVWPATIRDISEGGLGIVMGRRFERGAGLAIELPGKDGRTAETLLAKVVHTTELPGKRWLLGCSFISRLSEEEVRAVVTLAEALRTAAGPGATPLPGPLAPAEPVSPAGPTPAMSNLWFEGEAQDGQIVRIPVRNLYLKGMWPLPPGTTLRVWSGDKSTNPAGILIKVLDCRKQSDGWIVKYRPVQPLSAEVLRRIGFAD